MCLIKQDRILASAFRYSGNVYINAKMSFFEVMHSYKLITLSDRCLKNGAHRKRHRIGHLHTLADTLFHNINSSFQVISGNIGHIS